MKKASTDVMPLISLFYYQSRPLSFAGAVFSDLSADIAEGLFFSFFREHTQQKFQLCSGFFFDYSLALGTEKIVKGHIVPVVFLVVYL